MSCTMGTGESCSPEIDLLSLFWSLLELCEPMLDTNEHVLPSEKRHNVRRRI
jgi:hypothetical protein